MKFEFCSHGTFADWKYFCFERMDVDSSVYFICLTVRMYNTFMQWELRVWNEDNVLTLSLSLCRLEKIIKIFLVFYLAKLDRNTQFIHLIHCHVFMFIHNKKEKRLTTYVESQIDLIYSIKMWFFFSNCISLSRLFHWQSFFYCRLLLLWSFA